MELIILLSGGLIAVFILLRQKNRLKDKAGEAGEKIVGKKLKFWFGLGRSKVYNDIMFFTKSGKTTQIDHLVISRKGIFCIETKNMNGLIKGDSDKQYWLHINNKGQKHDFYNPIFQNNSHVKHVAQALGVDSDRIDGFVTNVGKAKLKGDIKPLIGANLIESGTSFIFKLWLKPSGALTQKEVDDFCEIIDQKITEINADTRREHIKYVSRFKSKKNSNLVFNLLCLVVVCLIAYIVVAF